MTQLANKKPRQVVRPQLVTPDMNVTGAEWCVRVSGCPLEQFNGWHFPVHDHRDGAHQLAVDLRRDIRDSIRAGKKSVRFIPG